METLSSEEQAKVRNAIQKAGIEILNKKTLTRDDYQKISVIRTMKSLLHGDRVLKKQRKK